MDHKTHGRSARFSDGTTFPTMASIRDLAYRCRYHRDTVTQDDLMHIAGILNVMERMVFLPFRESRFYIQKLRMTETEEKDHD